MQGYLKNPEETAKALDEDGWLHSGDLGYKDEDGFVFVTGRIKELIIKGGENISPREIDDVLYKHPDVLEAAAFGISDQRYGQEVMACIVLRPEAECSVQVIKHYCTEQLGDYKAPREIRLAQELPKGPSGKIQRLKVAELFDRLLP
jgi:acyl-CoA synthetase (AMP-forming)/AMP-acid ligase II